jgi:DNA (cytosine-5)-methyltransferase 1
MKILNLYACLGGNRYKWNQVKTDINVTAVELDPELAKLYQERFPNDNVIIADAHQYLIEHFEKFDFIWSSPPCPTHSRVRVSQKNRDGFKYKYPDMTLYQEIIFLDNFFEGKYCVENVIPYYEPLIPGKKRGRHLYWTNFNLPQKLSDRSCLVGQGKNEVYKLSCFHNFDFKKYKGKQRTDKIARNLVDYEAGKTIFNTVINILESKKTTQQSLF